MRLTYVTLLAALSLISLSCFGAEPAEKEAESGRLVDEFDGQLALDWKQIRPAPTHQSLTKSPGS